MCNYTSGKLTTYALASIILVVIIPNAKKAIIDIRKLRDYCLNPEHRVGRHKARLFTALLGMNQEDTESLRPILLQTIRIQEAALGIADTYGRRYLLDFRLDWRDRQATIRSVWNIRFDEGIPRLVTCYKKGPRRPPALAGGRQRVIRAGIGCRRGQRAALLRPKLFAVAPVLSRGYPYI